MTLYNVIHDILFVTLNITGLMEDFGTVMDSFITNVIPWVVALSIVWLIVDAIKNGSNSIVAMISRGIRNR